jgi:hypothetical protein
LENLDHLACKVPLEKMATMASRVPRGTAVLLGYRVCLGQLVHLETKDLPVAMEATASRESPVPEDQLEEMVKRGKWVSWEHQECEAWPEKKENEDHLENEECQDHQDPLVKAQVMMLLLWRR